MFAITSIILGIKAGSVLFAMNGLSGEGGELLSRLSLEKDFFKQNFENS